MEERNPLIIFLGALTLILMIFLGWMLSSGKVGLLAPQLESAARKTQQVDSSWQSLKAQEGPVTALLFYHEARDGHSFAVYHNPRNFSFGHFLSGSGDSPAIGESVLLVSRPGGEGGYTLLLSMNAPGVARVEVNRVGQSSGDPVTVFQMDPAEPFALILPAGEAVGDVISLYDAQGQAIPYVSGFEES